MEAPTQVVVVPGTIAVQVDGARPDDADRLARLRTQSLLADGDVLLGDLAAESARDAAAWGREAAENTWLIASRDGRAVGLARVVRYPHEQPAAHLEGVWVLPDARKAGVGAALVRRAEEHAAALGERALGLWVVDDNAAGRAFFERLGYRPRRPGVLSDGRTELEYTKTLRP